MSLQTHLNHRELAQLLLLQVLVWKRLCWLSFQTGQARPWVQQLQEPPVPQQLCWQQLGAC
jgi:hypothetical protein